MCFGGLIWTFEALKSDNLAFYLVQKFRVYDYKKKYHVDYTLF